MSFNSSNSFTAGNRTSIFETFGAVNLGADSPDDADDVIEMVRPVKSVARRSFEEENTTKQRVEVGPGTEVEEYQEGGGDDVECIEEENYAATLFMSCSPGRASSEEDGQDDVVWLENVEQDVFDGRDDDDDDFVVEQTTKPKKKKKPAESSSVKKKKAGDSLGEKKKKKKSSSTSAKKDGNKSSDSTGKKKSESSGGSKQKVAALKEPKKPLSSYALFYRDTLSVIKSDSPELNFGEMSKIVATMWDRLEPEQRKMYSDLADENKKEYTIKLQNYRVAVGDEDDTKQKTKKKKKSDKKASGKKCSSIEDHESSSDDQLFNNGVAEEEEEDSDSIGSSEENLQQPPSDDEWEPEVNQNLTNTLCTRKNCPNRSVEDPRWRREYCGAECVVNHCRDVFTSWVIQRREQSSTAMDT